MFPCDLCTQSFKFQYELIVHLKDHNNGSVKKPTSSKGCSYFSNKQKCILRLFLFEDYKCGVCQKAFARKETCANHYLWHSGRMYILVSV